MGLIILVAIGVAIGVALGIAFWPYLVVLVAAGVLLGLGALTGGFVAGWIEPDGVGAHVFGAIVGAIVAFFVFVGMAAEETWNYSDREDAAVVGYWKTVGISLVVCVVAGFISAEIRSRPHIESASPPATVGTPSAPSIEQTTTAPVAAVAPRSQRNSPNLVVRAQRTALSAAVTDSPPRLPIASGETRSDAPASRDRAAIDAACEMTREALGPGPFNRCVAQGIEDLRANPPATFDDVGLVDRQAIESACRMTGEALGPGPHNRCVTEGISELRTNPPPRFGAVSSINHDEIVTACEMTRTALGPGPYNKCLADGIRDLGTNPPPSFAGIATADRSAIEAACLMTRSALGPGPYNHCLTDGIRDLRANPRPPI